jgi:hypothetical protein
MNNIESNNQNGEISYLRPDGGFHMDDIISINKNMKLYYTVYDYRSYNKGSIYWKDISFHGDRLKINSDSTKTLGEVVNRDSRFYGPDAPNYDTKKGINLSSYCLILP